MVILPQWEVLSENPTEVMALFPLAVTLVTPLVIVMLPQYAAGPLPIPGASSDFAVSVCLET